MIPKNRILYTSLVGVLFNVVYSIYHICFGVSMHSAWLLVLGIYYIILTVGRLFVIRTKNEKRLIVKMTGFMLLSLSLVFAIVVFLAVVKGRGQKFNEIIMIAFAAYTFTKITVAIIHLIKFRKNDDVRITMLTRITFSEACASMFALQRSMLVSFGEMSKADIRIMNAFIGSGFALIVLFFGITLVISEN